jgi:excisionase family DNA binding protein
MTNQSFLLDERAVSETLSVSLATVRRWRYMGGGPRFLKLGNLVRYKREDLDQWLEGKGVAA